MNIWPFKKIDRKLIYKKIVTKINYNYRMYTVTVKLKDKESFSYTIETKDRKIHLDEALQQVITREDYSQCYSDRYPPPRPKYIIDSKTGRAWPLSELSQIQIVCDKEEVKEEDDITYEYTCTACKKEVNRCGTHRCSNYRIVETYKLMCIPDTEKQLESLDE